MTTIRKATLSDLEEMRRLLDEASLRGGIFPPITEIHLGAEHVLVLDAPDGSGLVAMAVLSIRGTRGHLRLLVIDRRYEHNGLEQRFLGVTGALSEALGARHFDVSSRRNAA